MAQDIGTYDYVIAGGGSAGCLLANRLSADPSVRVLLLEAGPGGERFWHPIPAGYKFTIGKPETDWCLSTEPEPELDNRRIPFPRGRGLGGSSLINGMIYTRGHRRDFDRWTQAGATGWGWDDVLPSFKRHECSEDGASEAHGGDGELHVQRQPVVFPFLSAIAQAAVEAGIAKTGDFNAGEPAGVGWYQVTQRRGRRWSAANAFLDPVRKRPNLRIETGAMAGSIGFEGRRVREIEFMQNGVAQCARIAGELVLCLGTIHTPWLLERSGIGDASRLAALGIGPVADLPGVGENLQDHLQVRQIYRLSGTKTLNQRLASPLGRAGMALEYALMRRGPMALAASQLGIFARSRPDKEIADLQYHVVPYSADKLGGDPHDYPGVTMSVCQLDPRSRGSVHARSAAGHEAPEIRANYLQDGEDKAAMLAGLRLTRHIMAQPALAPLNPQETLPGPQARDDESLMATVRAGAGSIFHPVGTCAMGTGPSAVLDPQLRVHGISGLRVADASAMPSVPSANTNAATMMIAERAADFMLRDRRATA